MMVARMGVRWVVPKVSAKAEQMAAGLAVTSAPTMVVATAVTMEPKMVVERAGLTEGQ
jgi:hypothetical protein